MQPCAVTYILTAHERRSRAAAQWIMQAPSTGCPEEPKKTATRLHLASVAGEGRLETFGGGIGHSAVRGHASGNASCKRRPAAAGWAPAARAIDGSFSRCAAAFIQSGTAARETPRRGPVAISTANAINERRRTTTANAAPPTYGATSEGLGFTTVPGSRQRAVMRPRRRVRSDASWTARCSPSLRANRRHPPAHPHRGSTSSRERARRQRPCHQAQDGREAV